MSIERSATTSIDKGHCSIVCSVQVAHRLDYPAILSRSADSLLACSSDQDEWQAELLRLLPLLCSASSSLGPHASSSLSIIVLVMQRYLTPLDWLPCLQSSLDMAALLQGAFQQLADSAGKQFHLKSSKKRQAGCQAASFSQACISLCQG